jgi:hypothetical protein
MVKWFSPRRARRTRTIRKIKTGGFQTRPYENFVLFVSFVVDEIV